MNLHHLKNKLRSEKGQPKKRVYKPKEPGRDGRKADIEVYGITDRGERLTRNNMESVLTYLEKKRKQSPSRNPLNDPVGKKKDTYGKAIDAGDRRLSVARRFVEIKHSGEPGPKSIDWSAGPGGGFGPKDISENQWRNMKLVIGAQSPLDKDVLNLLEDVFIRDEFPPHKNTKAGRENLYEQIRHALDCIARVWREMTESEFRERWPSNK